MASGYTEHILLRLPAHNNQYDQDDLSMFKCHSLQENALVPATMVFILLFLLSVSE